MSKISVDELNINLFKDLEIYKKHKEDLKDGDLSFIEFDIDKIIEELKKSKPDIDVEELKRQFAEKKHTHNLTEVADLQTKLGEKADKTELLSILEKLENEKDFVYVKGLKYTKISGDDFFNIIKPLLYASAIVNEITENETVGNGDFLKNIDEIRYRPEDKLLELEKDNLLIVLNKDKSYIEDFEQFCDDLKYGEIDYVYVFISDELYSSPNLVSQFIIENMPKLTENAMKKIDKYVTKDNLAETNNKLESKADKTELLSIDEKIEKLYKKPVNINGNLTRRISKSELFDLCSYIYIFEYVSLNWRYPSLTTDKFVSSDILKKYGIEVYDKNKELKIWDENGSNTIEKVITDDYYYIHCGKSIENTICKEYLLKLIMKGTSPFIIETISHYFNDLDRFIRFEEVPAIKGKANKEELFENKYPATLEVEYEGEKVIAHRTSKKELYDLLECIYTFANCEMYFDFPSDNKSNYSSVSAVKEYGVRIFKKDKTELTWNEYENLSYPQDEVIKEDYCYVYYGLSAENTPFNVYFLKNLMKCANQNIGEVVEMYFEPNSIEHMIDFDEIRAIKNKADKEHKHNIADINSLQTTLDSKANKSEILTKEQISKQIIDNTKDKADKSQVLLKQEFLEYSNKLEGKADKTELEEVNKKVDSIKNNGGSASESTEKEIDGALYRKVPKSTVISLLVLNALNDAEQSIPKEFGNNLEEFLNSVANLFIMKSFGFENERYVPLLTFLIETLNTDSPLEVPVLYTNTGMLTAENFDTADEFYIFKHNSIEITCSNIGVFQTCINLLNKNKKDLKEEIASLEERIKALENK